MKKDNPNANAVLVRLPEDMLLEVDKLVEEKRVKNRQAVIYEAIAIYLDVYRSTKRLYPNQICSTVE